MTFEKEMLADLLRDARELMNDTGRHWVQGSFQRPVHGDDGTVEYGYCSYGAIGHVTDGRPIEQLYAVRTALCVELGKDEAIANTPLDSELEASQDEEGNAYSRLVTFNDTEGRRWEEVEGAFRRTEDRLRAAS